MWVWNVKLSTLSQRAEATICKAGSLVGISGVGSGESSMLVISPDATAP